MPQVKSITVEVTHSWNYRSYKVGYTVDVDVGEDPSKIREALLLRCRAEVDEQIALDKAKVKK